jgi:hypothetical protein
MADCSPFLDSRYGWARLAVSLLLAAVGSADIGPMCWVMPVIQALWRESRRASLPIR